jgi:hypothetical protein
MSSQLEKELAPHWEAWKKAPHQTHTGNLLRAVEPILHTAVKSYGGHAAKSPTLLGKARRLAVDAFHSYDPHKGSMKSHLLSQLRRLQRSAGEELQAIRTPEQVSLDHHHLYRIENELRDQLGRDPSDAELSDRSGLSLKRLKYVRQIKPVIAEGTVFHGQNDDAFPAVRSMGDEHERAWAHLVYYDLTPIDQAIMDHGLGLHGRQRVGITELARRLNLTPGAVSQRAGKIQKLLDERFELQPGL